LEEFEDSNLSTDSIVRVLPLHYRSYVSTRRLTTPSARFFRIDLVCEGGVCGERRGDRVGRENFAAKVTTSDEIVVRANPAWGVDVSFPT
jgi:hypothetical protein